MIYLLVNLNLKSEKLDKVILTTGDVLKLVESAAPVLRAHDEAHSTRSRRPTDESRP